MMLYMMTDRAETAPATALIPVRVTGATDPTITYDQARAEMLDVMARGGLVLCTADPSFPRWFATQTEMNTPHTTFRVDAR